MSYKISLSISDEDLTTIRPIFSLFHGGSEVEFNILACSSNPTGYSVLSCYFDYIYLVKSSANSKARFP
ncbi:MAG: hypothetical protein ACJ70Q_09025 [Nitrososphaera sp.]